MNTGLGSLENLVFVVDDSVPSLDKDIQLFKNLVNVVSSLTVCFFTTVSLSAFPIACSYSRRSS
jgi:hypothetical protein